MLAVLLPASAVTTGAPPPAHVTVTAGKPSEFAFTVSPARVSSATIAFRVTNRGALPHAFTVCRSPLAATAPNRCAGASTKTLSPGRSATLVVSFGTSGRYEYLSPVAGQAAKGMKGTLAVTVPAAGVSAATTTGPAAGTTGSGTTSLPSTTTATVLAGDAAAGQRLFQSEGCTSCHDIGQVAAASNGNVSADLNSTHTGGPFPGGPLTAAQVAEIAAYVRSE